MSRFFNGWRGAALGVLMIATAMGPVKQAQAQETGKEIFEESCAVCHTIGKGQLIGPDLAGVTSRREAGWLFRQIKEPEKLIEEKDPIVMQLMKQSKNVPMADLDLSDAAVKAVIGFLESVEKQGQVSIGVPAQFTPTVIISLLLLLALTLIGLVVGKKKVDVR